MKIIISIIFFLCVLSAAQAQKHVTFFGSSVCYGASAENHQGYGWQLFHSGAIDTLKFKYFNASTGGDNTLKVEKMDRMTQKLYPTNPNYVVIGLSLGNEGIRTPQDDNGREQILEQYRSRLLAMADSFNNQGIKPIIVNCYAHSLFTREHYGYTKRMNRIINTWRYPSVNVLGTIDDLTGKWIEGYIADPWHPNTEGHKEMSYAFVPSLFEALETGKKTPVYDWNKSYHTIINKNKIDNPLTFDVQNIMHSFTLSFRFQETEEGSIAGFISDNTKHKIIIEGNSIQYKNIKTNYPKHLTKFPNHGKSWISVVLSHSYAMQKTMLFVNGELAGTIEEQVVPTQIYFGGTAAKTQLKDLTIHRSALNESEALALFNKKFIQSSLEIYCPLTHEIENNEIQNIAQSLSALKVNKGIELEFKEVNLY